MKEMFAALSKPVTLTGLIGMVVINSLIAGLFGGLAGGLAVLTCACAVIFCIGLEENK